MRWSTLRASRGGDENGRPTKKWQFTQLLFKSGIPYLIQCRRARKDSQAQPLSEGERGSTLPGVPASTPPGRILSLADPAPRTSASTMPASALITRTRPSTAALATHRPSGLQATSVGTPPGSAARGGPRSEELPDATQGPRARSTVRCCYNQKHTQTRYGSTTKKAR